MEHGLLPENSFKVREKNLEPGENPNIRAIQKKYQAKHMFHSVLKYNRILKGGN